MKIAVTATKPEREAALDRRFGRCGFFVIIDTQTDAWEAFPNPAQDASGGLVQIDPSMVQVDWPPDVVSGAPVTVTVGYNFTVATPLINAIVPDGV